MPKYGPSHEQNLSVQICPDLLQFCLLELLSSRSPHSYLSWLQIISTQTPSELYKETRFVTWGLQSQCLCTKHQFGI